MNLPSPFTYPAAPHARRHGPVGYAEYQTYKPFLRDEFAFRCVYCLVRERWYPNDADSFGADHFVPKVLNPERATDYDNLVYACNRCNSSKHKAALLLDPTGVCLGDHLRVLEKGEIKGLTNEGEYLARRLRLISPGARRWRREILLVLQLKQKLSDDPLIHELFLSKFGYPADLPDLTRLVPPDGNNRPDGIEASHYARRARGDLPEVY
jgi:hypothetical protein